MYNETLKSMYNETLIEGFNRETVQQAAIIIKALQGIDFTSVKLPTLAAARDAAVHDVDEIISTQSNRGFMKRFVTMLKKNNRNPFVDVLTFCDALENFFDSLLTYIDAKKTGVENASDLTFERLMSGTDEDVGSSVTSLVNNNAKTNDVKKLIINGFKPEKQLQRLSSDAWQKKYLKNNYQSFANELTKAKVSDIEKVGNEILQKMRNSSTVAKSIAKPETNAGSTGTQPSTGTEQSTTGKQPTGTSSTQPSDVEKPTNAKARQDALNTAKEVYDELHDRFENLDAETVKKIIAVLSYNDRIKV